MNNVIEIKICPDCQLEKPVSEFYKNSHNPKKYRRFCKLCWNKRVIKNVKKNLSHYRAYNRAWMQTPAGKFRQLKMWETSVRPIMFSQKEYIAWFKRQDVICHYCKQNLVLTSLDNPYGGTKNNKRGEQLTIDRKDNDLPYTLDNIVLCCRRCNMIKGKWFSEKQMLEIAQRYF